MLGRIRYIFIFLLLFLSWVVVSQNTSSVQGTVTDTVTGEGIPYASIRISGQVEGITSDINGKFYIKLAQLPSTITVSYIGYETKVVQILQNTIQPLQIKLQPSAVEISEVEVRVQKYKNKGNPAVELIKKVLGNKEKNRPEAFDYFQYKKYEQVELAFNNIGDNTRNSLLFRKMKFIFDYADTNRTNGKVFLPFFFRESLSDVYYRRSPNAEIEYIRSEYNTVVPELVDNLGVANFLSNLSQSVNIYDNSINLVTVDFVSPLSPISPNIYRFYILDTGVVNDTKLVHLYFAPRNKSDKAFIGNMWIALDSTYSVRKIDLGIPKEINLNWVNEMQISQEFDWVSTVNTINGKMITSRGLMIKSNEYFMDFAVLDNKKAKSLLGAKRIKYQDLQINRPIPDSIFKENIKIFRTVSTDTMSQAYLQQNRPDTLTRSQQNIIAMVDSLRNHKPFKNLIKLGKVFMHGYADVGPVSFGPVHNLYSFNSVEGTRLRVGLRTNEKFSKRLLLEGYAAYGLKDEHWKGKASARYSLTNGDVLKFPYNQLRVWYENEVKVPGQELNFIQPDNFLLSFKRGSNNKMVYQEVVGLEYTKESQSGFSYALGVRTSRQTPAGQLKFEYLQDGQLLTKHSMQLTQVGLTLRYAPNEEFYQTLYSRISLSNKYPKITLSYLLAAKDILGGEYNYHSVNLRFQKLFYISPLGYSKVHIDAGAVFGKVPFLLLKIHNANQSYSYQFDAYNLMNYLEFVSDRYASVHIFHNFQGILFNRLPLIKKLKLREVASFKAVFGGLSKNNNPFLNNNAGLFVFPMDAQGRQTTYTLDKEPYMEASFGISNLFRFFRLDYVMRLNYLSHPDISKWGIRFNFVFQF